MIGKVVNKDCLNDRKPIHRVVNTKSVPKIKDLWNSPSNFSDATARDTGSPQGIIQLTGKLSSKNASQALN